MRQRRFYGDGRPRANTNAANPSAVQGRFISQVCNVPGG